MTAIFTVLIIFLYDWSFNGILCINEDQILALHKAILPKLYLVGMYCNGVKCPVFLYYGFIDI